jgi:uncharacterized protein (TIGR02271 family)
MDFPQTDTDASSFRTPEQSNILSVSGTLNTLHPYTELRMPDGRVLRIATAVLMEGSVEGAIDEAGVRAPIPHETVIPIIEETLSVGKRVVETGKIRLQKTVQEYQEQLDEPLAVRTFDIERVVLNRPIESAPGVRQDGGTTIYPVVEEQLILTKQLILREEIRVTQRDSERRDNQIVTLHREHVVIERSPADPGKG